MGRKLTEATAIAALTTDDLVYVVDDPAGAPAGKKATIGTLQSHLNAMVTYENVLTVDAAGKGSYSSVAAAMAGISSPSATNRWLVLVSGDVTETTTVYVPSYTTIRGQGATAVKLADAADCHLIANDDAAAGNTDIRLENLNLDGNRSNQTNGLAANTSHSVYMENVTGLTIQNVHVTETIDQAFKLKDTTNLYVFNAGCDGAGTEGWSLDNVAYGYLANVYAKTVDGLDANGVDDRPGGGSSSGFEIEDGTNNVQFVNVTCKDCTRAAGFHTQSHGILYCSNININNLICIDCTGTAFSVGGLDGPVHLSGFHAEGSVTGIYINSANGSITISDFSIETTGGGYGIRFVTNTSCPVSLSNGTIDASNLGLAGLAGCSLGEATFSNVEIVAASRAFYFLSDLEFNYYGGSIHSTGDDAVKLDTAFDPPARFVGVKLTSDAGKALMVSTGGKGPGEFTNCYFCGYGQSIYLDDDAEAHFVGGLVECTADGGNQAGLVTAAGSIYKCVGVDFSDCSAGGGGRSLIGQVWAGCIVEGCRLNGGQKGLTSVSDGGILRGCYFSGQSIEPVDIQPAAGAIVHGNYGFVTENNGTDTIAAGNTSVTIAHGLNANATPTAADIQVTPTSSLGNASEFWISDVNAATFKINVDIAPGGAGAGFCWDCVKRF